MRHYCLGFVFDPDQHRVLLLQKRPTDRFNPGAWNGLGGRVEEGESAFEAMVRECAEEAGLQVDGRYWRCIGQLTDDETFLVDIFVATAYIDAAFQKTDEVVRIFDRATASNLEFATDVRDILSPWLNGGTIV